MPRKFASLRPMILLMMTLLSACAEQSPPICTDIEKVEDPWESINRSIFDSSTFMDRLLFRPLAELYRATIPPGIRARVAGVLGNMKEPVIFANDLLQGEFGKAGTTFERFGINTTMGIGGMWDIAGTWGLYQQPGDFGQTLAVWGAGEGPYLMLPFFGPSDLRDAFGRGVDIAMSPWQYIVYFDGGTGSLVEFESSSIGSDLVVKREQNIEKIDALRAGALDPYAQIRSAYLQHRRRQICGPLAGTLPEIGPDK